MRAAGHGARFEELVEIGRDLTKGEARAIEQALIERNRGVWQNINNSIDPKFGYFQDAVEWGEAWLVERGY